MLPFSINNFLQGRYQMGITSTLIVIILLGIAWLIKIERLKPLVTSCILIPSILIFLYLSIQNQGIIGILWSFPALLSFYTMLPEKHAWVANTLLFALLSILVWGHFSYEVSLRIGFTFAATSIFFHHFYPRDYYTTRQIKKSSSNGSINRGTQQNTAKSNLESPNLTMQTFGYSSIILNHRHRPF